LEFGLSARVIAGADDDPGLTAHPMHISPHEAAVTLVRTFPSLSA
jgi:hypothetical protein